MAKKSKKTKTAKRRNGGGSSTDIKAVGLAIAGAVLVNKITAEMKKKTGTMADLAPYAGLALGFGLPMFIKNPMVKQASLGMMVAGGLETLKKIAPKLVSGPYDMSVISGRNGRRKVNGGVMNPGAVGYNYSPNRSSVYSDNLKIISGTMAAAGM
jgi:hypothetical protein